MRKPRSLPLSRRKRPVKRPVQRTEQWISATAELGFDYCLKRSSRRRSVAISVNDNKVNLMAPVGFDAKELHQWLAEKASWVRKTLIAQAQRRDQIPNHQYTVGSTMPFLGVEYPLEIGQVTGRKATLEFVERGAESCFSLAIPNAFEGSDEERSDLIQTLFERFYKVRAREILKDQTYLYCQQLGVQYTDVRFRKTKSKWGHCTHAGVIQYNWLIIQASRHVVDYLAAHEVCHLRHHNHSQAFWDLVERVYPNYREAKSWLKNYGHTLTL